MWTMSNESGHASLLTGSSLGKKPWVDIHVDYVGPFLEKILISITDFFSNTAYKWSFPLRIFSVNVTKSAVSCEFGHIYWRNPQWKTSFFVLWKWIEVFPVETPSSKVTIRYLIHFSPMSHFYTPWKRKKILGFLTFSGGIEMWRWTKMG